MANNYLQFSEGFSLETKEEETWFREQLRQIEEYRETAPLTDEQRQRGEKLLGENGEPFPDWLTDAYPDPYDTPAVDFDIRMDQDGSGKGDIFFKSEEGNSPDIVCDLVSAFLARFYPDETFTLTYSETCSRMRCGEFGGGAAFVTAQGWNGMNAHGWVHAEAAYFAKHKKLRPLQAEE